MNAQEPSAPSSGLPPNRFLSALRSKTLQVGLWLGLADPYSAEVCAGAGFDWLLIDGEHAPNDLRSTLAQLRTLAAYPVSPVVRPVAGEAWLIKQYLDIGALTLLIPMVESAEQARTLVAATRYPPQGTRGVGSALARASRWNTVSGYLERAGEEICLLVQIESRAGLEQLKEIVAVDGVDGVFIGPADLSASLGHLGQPDHPEVQAAIRQAVLDVQVAGKAVGILSGDETLAREYIALGCTFVAVGVDVTLLARSARGLASRFGRGEGKPDLASNTVY